MNETKQKNGLGLKVKFKKSFETLLQNFGKGYNESCHKFCHGQGEQNAANI